MLLITQINVSILFSLVIRLILNESRINSKLAIFSPLNRFFFWGGGGIVRLIPFMRCLQNLNLKISTLCFKYGCNFCYRSRELKNR